MTLKQWKYLKINFKLKWHLIKLLTRIVRIQLCLKIYKVWSMTNALDPVRALCSPKARQVRAKHTQSPAQCSIITVIWTIRVYYSLLLSIFLTKSIGVLMNLNWSAVFMKSKTIKSTTCSLNQWYLIKINNLDRKYKKLHKVMWQSLDWRKSTSLTIRMLCLTPRIVSSNAQYALQTAIWPRVVHIASTH